MERKKDPMDQIIREDLQMEAEAIDRDLVEAGVQEMPVDVKERIKGRLYEQIAEYERERVYAQLSPEDREAMEYGRKMLAQKAAYRRKPVRVYVAVALVAVLVFAMGITSIGGTERIAQIIGIKIGNREITRIETDDNHMIINEREEEAYQQLKDVFGVEAVKIFHRPEGMEFVASEIDRDLQTALLIYEYKENNIHYFISSHYTDSSWGRDVEDEVTDQYYIEHDKAKIEVKEYEKPETKTKRYSANYVYNDLEYFLIGVMEQEKFDFLVKNLKFF